MTSFLRKAYGTLFGLQAVFFFGLALRIVWGQFQGPSATDPTPPFTYWMAAALVAIFALGIISAKAAWMVHSQAQRMKWWGIAASLLIITLGLPCAYLSAKYEGFRSLLFFAVAVLSIGVLGIALFAFMGKPDPVSNDEKGVEPIAGDGTVGLVNKLAGVVGLAVSLPPVFWWQHWAHANALPNQLGRILYIVPVLAVVIVVHELGHALAALSVEMKICSVSLGPFDLRMTRGRWKFKFTLARVPSIGGAVGVASTRANEPQWYRVWVAAAGPTANLLLAFIAFFLAVTAKGSPYEDYWGIFADLCTISLSTCLLNLVPLRIGGFYSDGAKIRQMLSGGWWADQLRVQELVISVGVTALRPRDYDLAAIGRLAQNPLNPLHALYYRAYAYECHLDRGEIATAREALALAELAAEKAGDSLGPDICFLFAFGAAYLQRNSITSRVWFERLKGKQTGEADEDYWLAHSALCWVEGDLGTAHESWQKGNDLAQKLPKTGSYEFGRHCFALLRQAMDEVPVSA